MIDIHTHLLFDVDDGSKSLEQSIQYLKEIQKIGMNKVVCTPHIKSGNRERALKIVNHFKVLREEAIKLEIDLYLGNEIMYSNETVDLLNHKKITTINHSKYVLVEFKRNESMEFDQILLFLEGLIENGYFPILAHPELYPNYRDINKMKKIKETGTMLQVDATSLFRHYSTRKIQKFTKKLFQERLVDVVASDSHCTKKRNFKVFKKAYHLSNRKYGKKYTNIIFYKNPFDILENN